MRLVQSDFLAGILILIFFAGAVAQDEAEIPPLTEQIVKQILIFEFDDLSEDQIEIISIKQLQSFGKAELKIRNKLTTLRFICEKTDFGVAWKFDGDNEIPQEVPQEDTAEAEKVQPQETLKPTEESPESTQTATVRKAPARYQAFVRKVVSSLTENKENEYSGFYFRDEDFDMFQVSEDNKDPRAKLASAREDFVEACKKCAGELDEFTEVKILSFLANRGSAIEKRRAKTIMPKSVLFIESVVVDLSLDGAFGKLTLVGLVSFADGWRVGEILPLEIDK